MPRTISTLDVQRILESGEFDDLLGCLEDECLECKSAPYRLEDDLQKMELAKDVSAMANAGGGVIVIGAQTKRSQDFQSDEIRGISCLPREAFDIQKHEDIVSSWIYPAIPGIKFAWFPSARAPVRGIASISIPLEATLEQPFLVAKIVHEDSRTIGSYVGFFERIRSSGKPTSVQKLHLRLKDGLRFSELAPRLDSLSQMVASISTKPTTSENPISQKAIDSRIISARGAMGYDGKPTLFFAAIPTEPTQFPTLFESSQAKIVELLQHPPTLRDNGFDLGGQRSSQILEGKLRRVLIPESRVLEVWRDGSIIAVRPGDESFLCWAMNSTESSGLVITSIALVEATYLFVDFTIKAYQEARPTPAKLILECGLVGMTVNGHPCRLYPGPHSRVPMVDAREAPGPNATAIVSADLENIDAGAISFQLVGDLYNWFGFDSTAIPYATANEGNTVLILE